ncbi:MAG: hypothetical protein JWM62_2822, partial [Frankiales bacterium]|nr:hypothetical protein [Frankiales bacterium]
MTLPAELHLATPRRARDDEPVASERLVALERLSDVAVRIASSVELHDTLDAIASGVVECLGFDAAVLNIVRGGAVEVAVVKGPPEILEALSGSSQPLQVWADLLERSSALGPLRFVDGRLDEDDLEGLLSWIPDIEVSDDPDQWHPMDALFAPLRATSGEMIGVLSVDLPRDGRRPGRTTLELMERFAGMASLAIERARMHKRVADSAQLFQRTFEDAPLGMALLTLDGRIEQANTKYAELVRRDRADLPGLFCWDLVHEDDREQVRLGALLVAAGRLPLGTGDMRDTSGQSWGAATASRIDGPDGPRLLVQLLDVTDQRRATAALRQQAVTDPLTGLRNRAGLAHHLRVLLDAQGGRASSGRVAVLFCDVDRFKLVNDTYGHAVGDELIVHVARALTTELRGVDTAARLGGDEFVVVLAGCDGPAGAIAAAERLRAAVCRPVTVGEVPLTPSLSIGIALSEPGSDPDLLLADADNALYRAKDAGRGRWELFAPEMRDENVARLRLREDLRHAVSDGELRLLYQPLVELATGRTSGYEALLRWQHPQRGLLLPAAFLDELMQGDLAAAATDWVLDQALADAASWPATAGQPPYVSINVSPHQLSRPDLPAAILSALQRNALEPDRLWVEVTEEAVVSDDVQLSALTVLREAGVHVALDDFGSGYAGLLALRHVPADVVKLDRAFTLDLLHDPVTAAIVEGVVRLCETLGRRLVAEGLESAEHVDAVRALGITHGQGWHLGRPQELASCAAPAGTARYGADLAGELR